MRFIFDCLTWPGGGLDGADGLLAASEEGGGGEGATRHSAAAKEAKKHYQRRRSKEEKDDKAGAEGTNRGGQKGMLKPGFRVVRLRELGLVLHRGKAVLQLFV